MDQWEQSPVGTTLGTVTSHNGDTLLINYLFRPTYLLTYYLLAITSPLQKRSGVARVVERSYTVTCTVLMYQPRRDGRLSWPTECAIQCTSTSATIAYHQGEVAVCSVIGVTRLILHGVHEKWVDIETRLRPSQQSLCWCNRHHCHVISWTGKIVGYWHYNTQANN